MSQIRFHIANMPSTDWVEETIFSRSEGIPTAVTVMSQLRAQFPLAAISIERRGDVRVPNPVKQFRYKILLPHNETRYSKLVGEQEREALRAEIAEQFPAATVIEEVF